MAQLPPARLSDRPLHSRSTTSSSNDSTKLGNFTFIGSDHPLDKSITKNESNYTQNEQRYAQWGIAWYPPTLMILYALGGTVLAVGHHVYFSSLHGTLAGSSARQQWATGFGTAISFLVVALLRAATCAGYGQYVWSIVKKRGYSLSTLDKLFALTTDPTGFFGLEMLRHAKIAMLVALICWITPLAGIAPPATLSVVPGLISEARQTSMASLNWNSPSFYDIQPDYTLPSADVSGIATRSALGTEILPLDPPGPNSTFHLQFYGPSVKCSLANSTQQEVLDYYTKVAQQSRSFVTKESLEQDLKNTTQFDSRIPRTIESYRMLVLSAFAPYSGIQGWLWGISAADRVDQFNNWNVDLPWDADELGFTVDSTLYDDIIQKLYVQTSTAGYVCLMGNASYNVDFEFINGAQTMVKHTTSDFEPVEMMRSGGGAGGGAMQNAIVPGPYQRKGHTGFELSYMAVWQSFASLISGNITFGYVPLQNPDGQGGVSNLTMIDLSSRTLLNGLSGCDDVSKNFWQNLPFTLPNSKESPASFFNTSNLATMETPNRLFKRPSSMCRNSTLIKAIEDLAENITISMLSSVSLTTPNATLVNVTYQSTRNVYRYDNRNLIISYAVAVALAVIGWGIGMSAFWDNGVAHSNSFSAMIATTRNPMLDQLSQGHSLGAIPLDREIADVKLKFGGLNMNVGGTGYGGEVTKRAGFGLENDTSSLQKGGRYL